MKLPRPPQQQLLRPRHVRKFFNRLSLSLSLPFLTLSVTHTLPRDSIAQPSLCMVLALPISISCIQPHFYTHRHSVTVFWHIVSFTHSSLFSHSICTLSLFLIFCLSHSLQQGYQEFLSPGLHLHQINPFIIFLFLLLNALLREKATNYQNANL